MTGNASAAGNGDNTTTTLRLLLFTFYFSLGCISFKPAYYHSLGHDGQIIGMLGAIKPFTTFVVGPLWALISDFTGNPMLILKVTLFVPVLSQVLEGARSEPWFIMTIVFITSLFSAPVKSLLDNMILTQLQDRSSFGRLRLWGSVGYASGTYTTGYLLSITTADDQNTSLVSSFLHMVLPEGVQKLLQPYFTGYKLMFVIYAALAVPVWFCICSLPNMNQTNETNNSKQRDQSTVKTSRQAEGAGNLAKLKSGPDTTKRSIFTLFRSPDVMLFFLLVLAIGINSGVSENFAYVRIREVGGTSKDMGLSRLIGACVGIPMMWFSKGLTQRMSTDRILILVLLCSVVRFSILGSLTQAYQALPAEALRSLAFSAYLSSSTIHARKISPPGLNATILMFVSALYAGLGQSIGALAGGKLFDAYGTAKMFRFVALSNAILLFILLGFLLYRTFADFSFQGRIHEASREKVKMA